MNLRTEWSEARRQYETMLDGGLTLALWRVAADDFERLCGSPPLADVAGLIDEFVEALRREGVDRESLSIYREAVEGVVAWATTQLRAAA